MTAPPWSRIKDIFQAALDRPPDERPAWLHQMCGEDRGLLEDVESLLASHELAGSFADDPAQELLKEPAPSDDDGTSDSTGRLHAGDLLGVYEIQSLLGAGGMGEVYKARDTRLDRSVAIKILLRESASDPQRRERFRREGRAISQLTHPHICTLYDVGTHEGSDYLVMECLEGETLADRLKSGRLPLDHTFRHAIQIADALDAAHARGIIHRDLKPSNIFLTTRGDAKILDFGVSKIDLSSRVGVSDATLTRPETLTDVSVAVGTLAYMSPEQVRGEALDGRSDLFSFGIILYEMSTGRRLFTGATSGVIADAILNRTTEPMSRVNVLIPPAFEAILTKALEKDRRLRYQRAGDLRNDLQLVRDADSPTALVGSTQKREEPTSHGSRRFVSALVVAATVIFAIATVGWLWLRSSRERWALEQAPEIARLVEAEDFGKAAALMREARAILPKDSTLTRLWARATEGATIETVPTAADVSIRPYRGDPNEWETLGQTPLKKVRVPKNDYVWRIAKSGFVSVSFIDEPPVELILTLSRQGTVPTGMVVVSGGETALGFPFAYAPPVRLADFCIDRHEVTNEEYKAFVDGGGYQKQEFWQEPLIKDGRQIAWEAAMSSFTDSTGRRGPATWEAGSFPKGLEKHPVAGVSWYEAAAYAQFAGKSLPTVYHWTCAAQTDFAWLIAPGSNFSNVGTAPVGGPRAMSGFGTTDMAGNVKEWCWNESSAGRRFSLGGGFGEQPYLFNQMATQSPWDRRANYGFRCVKLASPPPTAAAARIELPPVRDFQKERPVSDEVFKAFEGLYAYDHGALNARVEETQTSGEWTREKVSFNAAYGGERVTAQLFLPTHASPPFQAVVFFPHSNAFLEHQFDLSWIDEGLDFVLKSGRALMFPIYKGTFERRDGLKPGGPTSNPPGLWRDHVIAWSKDLGRSLDYLATREEIDSTKIAYYGVSTGGACAPVLLAIEERVRAAILASAGLYSQRLLPEADGINFVTHVRIPVLMLNGRFDDVLPVDSSQVTLFRLLGTPGKDKKYLIFEAGHTVPYRERVRETLDWLDKYLGPAKR